MAAITSTVDTLDMRRGMAFAGLLHLTAAVMLVAWPAAHPAIDEAPTVAVYFTPPAPPPPTPPEPQPQPQAQAEPAKPAAPVAKVRPAAQPRQPAPAATPAPDTLAAPAAQDAPAPAAPAAAAPAPAPAPAPAASASDVEPTPVEMPRPAYPLLARRKGWEGVVLLALEVNELGCPNTVAVKRSSGYQALDDAAIEAARRWHFEPARKQGRITTAMVEVPIRFSLKDA